MLLGAGAELVTIGAVIPFISLMADPETAFQFPILQNLFSALGWQQPESIVAPMTVLFLLIIAFATATRLLLLWVSTRYVYALGYDIGVALYNRVLNQPYSFHIAHNTSEIIAAVNKVQAVLSGAVKPVLQGTIAIALGTAIIATLIYIQPGATATAAVVFVTAYLLIGGLVRVRLKANGKRIAAAQTQRVRCIQEGLGGIRDVILDNSQAQITRTFKNVDQKLRRAQGTNGILNQMPRYFIETIGVFLIIALAWYLSNQAGGLMAALPLLGALALGAQRLLPLLQKIYQAWAKMNGNQQMFADVLDLLELPEPAKLDKGAFKPIPFEQEIRLQNVGFRYAAGHEQVLQNIDLTIPKGTRLGIVGPTGSGKSTLVDIIMGLLEPVEGQILVDNVPINESNRHRWRQRISHVPQHIFLADATIAENIAIGMPTKQIDMDRVRHAARCACIADFVESRPDGYHAKVGERGIQLSGGQRQRIGIARAIYRHADVIVLDEATSALDTDTENAVMAALDQLDETLTVIMIAHRVQTLRECDQLIRLDAGQLTETGCFQEVIVT
ncbi:MAG: ABC transporter ATP-binding protein [Wenzhouxiangella sp.]